MTGSISGSEIARVREITSEECHREGWPDRRAEGVPVLELEDGRILYPSADPEGNSPGALFGLDTDTDEAFFVHPPREDA